MNVVDRHNLILKEIAFAADAMARSSDWRDGIDELLARLGRSVSVSRVYLFEVEYSPEGTLSHTCRHDWAAPGLERLAGSPRYTGEVLDDYDPEFDRWIERRRRGEMIQGHTRELSGVLREDFEYQRIKSFVSIPIQLEGEWWGHLGFDDCIRERNWGADELHLLQTTAALIGAAVARERTARQLRSNDALRAAMLDVALDCIVMIDEQGTVLEFNPAAEATFGWPRDAMIGRQASVLLVPERFRAAHDAAFGEATRSRRMRQAGGRTELFALKADGSEFPIELTVTQIDHGAKIVYAAFIRDLTDRHAAEARLREIERERTNLARFFSPQLVDQLVAIDTPLSVARYQAAAILFVDMVGFTAYCSQTTPHAVIAMLRDLLALLSEVVFAHHGTIDKFLGDGLIAVFGSPLPGPKDATNAARCALDIQRAIDRWNGRRRQAADGKPIRVGVGIHYGQVVLGDVGGDKRLELTVLGDTVNIASRVEGYCRSLDAAVLVTEALVAALCREGSRRLADRFADEGCHTLRGRSEPVHLYSVRRTCDAIVDQA